jgi:hypothetical protein
LDEDTFSAAISIRPALSSIGNYEEIVYVLKGISKIVKTHRMFFMDVDISLSEVKAFKCDSEYYLSRNSIRKSFIDTSFKPICEVDLSNSNFMQEATRENQWLPLKAWSFIGLISSGIIGRFPVFGNRRPTIFPVFTVARSEK